MTVCGEKVTGVCVAAKCPHFKRCCPVVWDKYGRIKPQTNEEWFTSLPTEEKAKVFANATYSTAEAPLSILVCGKEAEQKKWEMWLKQPHREVKNDGY